MGIVAGKTFPLAHRLMHHPLAVSFARILMARIAEVLRFLLKQAAESCHMGTVAGGTLPRGSRFMFHPLLKSGPVVAGKTIDGRRGRPRGRQKEDQGSGQGQGSLYKTR